MALRFDEKGKYFTDYITKESIPVVIQTPHERIFGYVYVVEDDRLSDELNRHDRFIPVTQAVIEDQNGQTLYETDFLVVNREQIIWLFPQKASKDDAVEIEETA